ncbi:hypothetical protein MHYP_G00304730 [Metynnis hypsauchen]
MPLSSNTQKCQAKGREKDTLMASLERTRQRTENEICGEDGGQREMLQIVRDERATGLFLQSAAFAQGQSGNFTCGPHTRPPTHSLLKRVGQRIGIRLGTRKGIDG